MTVEFGNGPKSGLVGRIQGIILKPKAEWAVIDAEPATVQGLYTGYVLLLAAVPAVGSLIGSLFFASTLGSFGGYGLTVRLPMFLLVASAVVSYVVSLIMVFVMALLIDAFATSFGAVKDRTQAMKVAAYAPTAVWVAGVALLIPVLGGLVMLAALVYTIFVFHFGLRTVMKAPEDKGVGYTAVVIIVSIVAAFLINMVLVMPVTLMSARAAYSSNAAGSLSLNLPEGGSVNLGEAVSKLEDAAKQAQEGGGVTADPASLQALLPGTVAGYTRTEVSSSSGGIGPMSGSGAQGVFTKGDSRVELTIADIGAMGGAMAGLIQLSSNRETQTGYEKITTANGRTVMEKYDRSNREGSYSVMVGSRFVIAAEGSNVDIGALKNMVETIPTGQLEALARG